MTGYEKFKMVKEEMNKNIDVKHNRLMFVQCLRVAYFNKYRQYTTGVKCDDFVRKCLITTAHELKSVINLDISDSMLYDWVDNAILNIETELLNESYR